MTNRAPPGRLGQAQLQGGRRENVISEVWSDDRRRLFFAVRDARLVTDKCRLLKWPAATKHRQLVSPGAVECSTLCVRVGAGAWGGANVARAVSAALLPM